MCLGVAQENQTYLGLPDGKLNDPNYIALAVSSIRHLVTRQGITAILTLGKEGYCGHTDHIATHNAALLAQATLRSEGTGVEIFAINNQGEGAIRIPVNRSRKLGALAFHGTQMDLTRGVDGSVTVGPAFAGSFQKTHGPLLEFETYDHLLFDATHLTAPSYAMQAS